MSEFALSDWPDRLSEDPPKPPEDTGSLADPDDDEESDLSSPVNLVDEKKLGPLLEKPPKEAVRIAMRMWNEQNKPMNRRKERWKANRWRREGVVGVQVRRVDQDRNDLYAWAPPNASRMAPSLNKAARLSRRLTANVFADPPTPDAQPDKDDDTSRAAAELATRVVDQLSDESGLNLYQAFRDTLDTACTYDSGFLHFWVDETGGGHRPVDVLACPTATDATKPDIDPATGSKYQGDYILRYVAKGGKTLTDDVSEAALQWVPRIKKELVDGRHVRFLPQTEQLQDADGCMIGKFVPLGVLKGRFPDTIGKMKDGDLRTMTAYRPERYRDLMPDWVGEVPSGYEGTTESGTTRDDALAFCLTTYYRATPQYPKGCYFVCCGNKFLAHRETNSAIMEDGAEEMLDIPVAQERMFREGEDDPYGFGMMYILGSGNELRAAQIGAWVEHLDRFNNRKTFVPLHSIYQPKSHLLQTSTVIPINTGGEPKYEEIPEYPQTAIELLKLATDEMNDESGLQEAAQGLQTPDVKSGIHARYIIEQVSIGISDVKQNTEAFIKRSWRIVLQLMRAYYTQGQKIRWMGEDGSYKESEWSRADLGSIRDVDIAKGSFTLMSPSVKAGVAGELADAGLMSKDEWKRTVVGNLGGLLDLQDDPFLMRIKRQLARWKEGPDPKVELADNAWQRELQQKGPQLVTPQTPPQNSPMQAAAARLFQRLPIDLEQDAAVTRHGEIRRVMASTDFAKATPAWQQALAAEYEQMRQAAGVQTVQEQAEAAQQQRELELQIKQIPQIKGTGLVTPQTVGPFEQAATAGFQQPQQANGTTGAPPAQQPAQAGGGGQPGPGSAQASPSPNQTQLSVASSNR